MRQRLEELQVGIQTTKYEGAGDVEHPPEQDSGTPPDGKTGVGKSAPAFPDQIKKGKITSEKKYYIAGEVGLLRVVQEYERRIDALERIEHFIENIKADAQDENKQTPDYKLDIHLNPSGGDTRGDDSH